MSKTSVPGRDVQAALNGAKVSRPVPFGLAESNGHQPAPTPYNWRQHVRSARDLRQKELVRAPDLVTDIIPSGLTALAGRPKAGKTTLCLQVALGVSGMLPTVLGERCATGRVLYLAVEDYERRLQERIGQMLGLDGMDEQLNPREWDERFEYVTRDGHWPDWPHGGLERLTEYVSANRDATLVIIDSAPLFRGPIPKQGGYDVDYQYTDALANWVSQTGVSLLVTWHTTKAHITDDLEADPLAMLQNTTGIAAGLDTGLVMARKDGVMTLYRRGRDLDDDSPIRLKDDKDSLLWRPDSTQAALPARESVLKALAVASAPMKPREIASLMGLRLDATRKALERLSAELPSPITLYGAGYWLTSRGVPR